ncbi:MarR family winged helix-turn-helix transcriptional regulator [Natranaerobius thermophilus]|uniref:Transcriptional regulator, MarR family n=1 Tax=Natranaerobius thermophilus (strain ATCC BAA-1301 / DSM 18059 / JW/NM-WN-LF) TaxID=457570 RepID=B2A862_NATTJ|nr:MarR family transcriptional regulator [Natranaerobius thermophilus]ACB84428.1 transcriptional regulator, MarR family [Natranaerobius thermophilus JW/NM-WN-LF]
MSEDVLNELLVDTFNDILAIQQRALQSRGLKDLSISEVHTIEKIGKYSRRTMSEVANELGITIGTLSTAINHLVKKGYVERVRSEEDRRIVYIKLTQKGMKANRIHEIFHNEMIEEAISELEEGEKEALIKSMGKLNAFFKNQQKLINQENADGSDN